MLIEVVFEEPFHQAGQECIVAAIVVNYQLILTDMANTSQVKSQQNLVLVKDTILTTLLKLFLLSCAGEEGHMEAQYSICRVLSIMSKNSPFYLLFIALASDFDLCTPHKKAHKQLLQFYRA